MEFLEKDLEDIIFDTDNDKLQDRGLNIIGFKKRQLRIGKYGVADLVTFSSSINRDDYEKSKGEKITPYLHITVYELKKDKVGVNAFMQAVGYIKGIQRYLEKRDFKFKVCYSIALIGRTIEFSTGFSYLPDVCNYDRVEFDYSEFLTIYTYSYNALNGVEFNDKSGYKLIDEGF